MKNQSVENKPANSLVLEILFPNQYILLPPAADLYAGYSYQNEIQIHLEIIKKRNLKTNVVNFWKKENSILKFSAKIQAYNCC